MQNVVRKHTPFNTLPLWKAARDREFLALSYAERKLAEEFCLEPHVAKFYAMQAYGSGGWR